jgi:hypothetical protein
MENPTRSCRTCKYSNVKGFASLSKKCNKCLDVANTYSRITSKYRIPYEMDSYLHGINWEEKK